MAYRFQRMVSQGPGPDDGGALFRPFTEDAALSSATATKDDLFAPNPDVRLEDGMPLPKYLRDKFPRGLKGKPIQEIDPFYYGRKTFLVISENWTIHRISALKSLWLFSPFNRLRWFAIRILTHSYYRYLMILVITSAFFTTSAFQSSFSRFATLYFYIFFTIEMIFKIIAHGFLLTPMTYLRRTWNWLDFLLNLTGWTLEIFVDRVHGFQAFRVFRIIHLFTYSRISFSWMFRSIRQAKDLLIYSIFLFVFFNIVGLTIFRGQFMNKCVPNVNLTVEDITRLPIELASNTWLKAVGDYEFFICGNVTGSGQCPANYTCQPGLGSNPNYGYTAFDTFGWAALQTARLMTRDYWEDLIKTIHGSTGPFHIGFILTVIFYGGYLLTNFFVAHMAIGVSQMIEVLEGKKPKLLFRTVGVPVDRSALNNCSKLQESNSKTDYDKEHDGINENDTVANANDFSSPPTEQDGLTATEPKEVEGVVIITNMEPKTEGGEKDEEKDTDNLTEKPRTNPIAAMCGACVNLFCEWNCCPCCIKFQNLLSRFVINRYFNLFICVVITINIIFFSLDHHNMSMQLAHFLEIGSYICALIYIVEAILKILALNPKQYFSDRWNIFDFIVVLMILLELGIENLVGLSILRAFRVLRIFRLARWWPGIGLLVKIVNVNTLALLVFSVVMASFGLTLFQSNYTQRQALFYKGELPRWSYVDYHHSLMSVVRILCGEWIEGLWDCMLVGNWLCLPFVFTVIIFGNLIIINLFVVMVFSSLQSNNLCETENDDEQNLLAIFNNFFRSVCPSRLCPSKSLAQQEKAKSQEELCEISNEVTDVKVVEPPTVCDDDTLIAQPCLCNACYTCLPWCRRGESGGASSSLADPTSFSSKGQILRNRILVLLNTKYLGIIYTVFLVVAAIASMNKPMIFGHVMDYIVLVAFVGEIILNIIGKGFKVYFCNGWTSFDFAITFLHVISLVLRIHFGYDTFPLAFRPLKFLVRLESAKVVISAMLYRVFVLVDALVACGVIWLLFAIMGVQLFAGNYHSCRDENNDFMSIVDVNHLQSCIGQNLTWVNQHVNFDNVANAFFALLQVATFKGWIGVISDAVDARGIDYQPSREVNIDAGWYFIVFIITGVLFPFIVLVTAFIRKINDQKKKVGGYLEILMTEEQRKAYAPKKETYFKTPKKSLPQPTWGPRPLIYRMVTNRKFEITIIIFLIFNAIAMSVSAYDITERLYLALDYVDIVFVGVFAIELTLKLIAFGGGFFSLAWNIYDFVVIGMPILLIVLNHTIDHDFSDKYLVSPGVFGILRMVRLIRWLKWIRRVVHNIWMSLVAYNNIGLVLMLVCYTYSLLGIVWFSQVELSAGLDEYRNFRGPLQAMVTLLQVVTLAGWDGVYEGLIRDMDVSQCCAAFFVLSFMFIIIYLLLEVGTVILLENYHRVHEKYRLGLTDQELEDFVAAWHCFDPLATGFIAHTQLFDLISILPTPLHLADMSAEGVDSLAVPRDKEDRVTFAHVLRAILADVDDERKISRPTSSGFAAGDRSIDRRAEGESDGRRGAADRVKSWCRGCFAGKKKLVIAEKGDDSAGPVV